jgi:hypothetical protein
MQRLRNARLLVQFLLAWWVLAIGVAIAAPLVHAQPLEMVCSVGGSMKWVASAAADTPGSFGDLTIAAGATGLARFTIMFSSATAYVFTRTA